MDVSVIIINYNTFDLTKAALESIFLHTKELCYEVILVDNASPDGSGERLRELFEDICSLAQSRYSDQRQFPQETLRLHGTGRTMRHLRRKCA